MLVYRNFFLCLVRGKHVSTVKKQVRLSEKRLLQKYVDQKRIRLFAGNGGNGMSCFLRDKITAAGGPSGGDGGKGGDVILVADQSLKSLQNVETVYRAESGTDGHNHNMFGKDGKDLFVKVPIGTFFHLRDSLEIVADLQKDGDSFLACSGGMGGKGNRFFVSSTNTTPERCLPGEPGESISLVAELRTIAHGGLVGFPNAGKSTLLRALTRAKPAIGEYEFTTLVPHVGIVHYEDFEQIAVADTPGIIEGAHLNKGLGFRFLKHIEKCRFLLFVIDMSRGDPWDQLYTIQNEFSQYDFTLNDRPYLVLANKIDLPDAEENYELFCEEVEHIVPLSNIMPVSGKKKYMLEDLILKIREFYDKDLEKVESQGDVIPIW